ncbi:hypothetical protein LCGC14_2505770 [marine sediment metagenome]|uniref:Uncharacterized protein n=1 Tax=marine sediment metagenome TaxID=412755 RepID=A0A0F9BNL6_9ZZZZ
MKPIERTLRDRIKFLEEDRKEVYEDRQKFRDYFSAKLGQFIDLQGKGSVVHSGSMIEDLAKLFQRVQWFRW